MTQPAIVLMLTSLLLTSPRVIAQKWWLPPERDLTAADYGRFEQLGNAVLSPDGRFVAWSSSTVAGDSLAQLARIGADGVEGERVEFEGGRQPTFSRDAKFVVVRKSVSETEREKLDKAKKPAHDAAVIFDLVTGDKAEIEGVQAFAFSDDGRFLALQRYRGKDQKKGGVDVLVRDLSRGVDTTFGHVGEYAWADEAPLLAMVVDTPDRVGNGVRIYDAATESLRTLDSAAARYRRLAWRRDAVDLAVLRAIEKDESEKTPAADEGDDQGDGQGKTAAVQGGEEDDEAEAAHEVLAWRGLDRAEPSATRFDPSKATAFPADYRIVEYAGLRWAVAGDAVFFGIRPDPVAAELETGLAGSLRAELKDPAGVEVWHAKDIDIIPLQKKTLQIDQHKSSLCALWLDGDVFARLGDELTEDVDLVDGERWGLGRDHDPYKTEQRFGPTVFDVYIVDTKTGEKDQILQRCKYLLGSSPDGRFVTYMKEGNLWSYEIGADEHRNLTAGLDGAFVNAERNVLTDENPPYGITGWAEDGQRVYVHDKWDLWSIASDGSGASRLTRGAEEAVQHRRLSFERRAHRQRIVDAAAPILVSSYGDRSKQSGYARIRPDGEVERLVWRDCRIDGLVKAEKADVYAYIEQAFDDSPDVFVADGSLLARQQVSETNPFQARFRWGRAELVEYESSAGEPLQGALLYPAGYEPGKRYPMITYIYERLSQQLHSWTAPSERRPYNATVFTSQGYFVLMPDIVYRPQNPGLSSVDCVVPAVEKVLERGDIDPARVGLVGHSWGAYQTAFLVTHSDVFAAGVAGAPLTNMISMSMSVYWNSGQTDAWIFHESQGRMDRPFWQDLDTYVANSPIFGLEQMKTPLLVAFGDEDGAVDWQQGVEFYNAARLAQKPVVMLVYPGENHGLRQKANQVDYHHRVLAWFGHWLKGEPAPAWISSGQTWIERQRELKAFEKKRKGKAKRKAG